MNLQLVIFIAVASASISLAILVLIHNATRTINRLFSLFALAVAAWTLGIATTTYLVPAAISVLFARLTFAAACISVYSLLAFLTSFPSGPPLRRSPPVLILGTIALLLVFLSQSPWLVTGVFLTSRGLRVTYGPLYLPFAFFILLCVGYSFVVILNKHRGTSGRERLQIKYLFFGLILPGLLATVTNLIIPLIYGHSPASQYGPLFALIMIVLVAHTIIRHRLMDIRVFISRSVAYGLTVTTASALFLLVLTLFKAFERTSRGDSAVWLDLATAMLIALLFQPLKQWIQRGTDKYLHRHTYNYQSTLREASARMAGLLDLSSLLDYLSNFIVVTTHAESVSIYTGGPNGSFDRTSGTSFEANFHPSSLSPTSPLLREVLRATGALLTEDLATHPATVDAATYLGSIGVELVLPMSSEAELIAFLMLGRKRSGDPYFAEDLNLLSTLSSQASVAIKNAQLYRQVIHVNKYIENLLETMESGVIAVDGDAKITRFNRTAARLTLSGPHNVLDRSLTNLPFPLRTQLVATLSDGQARLHLESVLPDSDGRFVPIAASSTAIRDGDSSILGAVIVFNDLTRLKELEVEKRRVERLASLGALASGIAHEIKNPLVAIRTFAELLPDRYSDDEFRNTFSQVAIREIERIDHLVARLRGLAVPADHSFRPVNLVEPLEETLALLRGQLEQKHICVYRVFSQHTAFVAGDFAQLKQLFLNIFLNAIDALDGTGTITVRLTTNDAEPLRRATVLVSDTGTGILPSLLGRLFDPFVTTKSDGSGLGLAICRGITDAHNATIRIQNNGREPGTTVTLTFPLIDVPTALVTQ
jgi:PAS domain S-box-containing protein